MGGGLGSAHEVKAHRRLLERVARRGPARHGAIRRAVHDLTGRSGASRMACTVFAAQGSSCRLHTNAPFSGRTEQRAPAASSTRQARMLGYAEASERAIRHRRRRKHASAGLAGGRAGTSRPRWSESSHPKSAWSTGLVHISESGESAGAAIPASASGSAGDRYPSKSDVNRYSTWECVTTVCRANVHPSQPPTVRPMRAHGLPKDRRTTAPAEAARRGAAWYDAPHNGQRTTGSVAAQTLGTN